ncbi:hypothetical protein CYY_010292 [Polysphondylium violaceum]|uniref:Carbohydrate binding domain-containing protein n=1 Tax=Polysphondylium violaceum TaxID=133409 RepID=A0A8J4UTZ1_9MYCE|nr:hypothetical protein CYY_010292 [Polysphondylium violaceum]
MKVIFLMIFGLTVSVIFGEYRIPTDKYTYKNIPAGQFVPSDCPFSTGNLNTTCFHAQNYLNTRVYYETESGKLIINNNVYLVFYNHKNEDFVGVYAKTTTNLPKIVVDNGTSRCYFKSFSQFYSNVRFGELLYMSPSENCYNHDQTRVVVKA